MSPAKPKLVITPEVVEERGACMKEYAEWLKQKFDVHTVENKKAISRREFLDNVRGAFGILCSASQSINEEVVEAAGPTLKVISQPSAGFNNIDGDAMRRHSIRIGLAGKAVTAAAAEMAVTILLAASRQCVTIVNAYRNNPIAYFQQKGRTADGLEESIVGIVGVGRVGTSIAEKVAQFNLEKLMYWDRKEKNRMRDLKAEFTSLENLFTKCDYIIVSIAYNNETVKIVNKKLIDLMKPTALIVNIGRGGLVDQDYLVEALQSRRIGGAALDVTEPEPLPPDHPLFKQDNVLLGEPFYELVTGTKNSIRAASVSKDDRFLWHFWCHKMLTPHVGGVTSVANKNATKIAVQNILAVLDNSQMPDELKL